MSLRSSLIVGFIVILSAHVAGQDDVLGQAREAAASGRLRGCATMLEAHLVDAPRDVDARLVYGLVLWWEGRYDDDARRPGAGLAQTPACAPMRASPS